jgi:hypothetical protein
MLILQDLLFNERINENEKFLQCFWIEYLRGKSYLQGYCLQIRIDGERYRSRAARNSLPIRVEQNPNDKLYEEICGIYKERSQVCVYRTWTYKIEQGWEKYNGNIQGDTFRIGTQLALHDGA